MIDQTQCNHNHTVTIAHSKTKLWQGMLLILVILGIGLAMILYGILFETTWGRVFISIVGSLVVIAGLIALVLNVPKLRDTKPGLVIDARGITSNTGDDHSGLVLWEDIQNIEWLMYLFGNRAGENMLVVKVRNPQDYIGRAPNALRRKGMELALKQYGAPIVITATYLKISTKDLADLLIKRLEAYWEHAARYARPN